MKTALLFGSTGFIGSHLLTELLDDGEYSQVIAVTRRPLATMHAKLKNLIGDFHLLEGFSAELKADEVFIALGTTKAHTPNQATYYQIDHDYPVLAAKLAKLNGAKSVFVVTAIGANVDSKFFYIRTKGEVERDICALDFQHTHIFQPSMILGEREEERTMEKSLIKIWKFVDGVFPASLSKYKGIDGVDIAKAMRNAGKIQSAKLKIYQWREMNQLVHPGQP